MITFFIYSWIKTNKCLHNKISVANLNASLSKLPLIKNSQRKLNFVKSITTNLTNPYFISATFRTCFFTPFSSFNDEKIKLQVLQ